MTSPYLSPLPFQGERNHQRKPRLDRTVRLAALFQIALVIFFRAPKLRGRLDLGHDWSIKFAALSYFLLRLFGRGFLFRRMIENHGAVLGADIRALSIQSRRIVVRPENVEELIVIDLGRIEFQLNNLSVASVIAANIFVARIVFVSARIPDSGRCDTL